MHLDEHENLTFRKRPDKHSRRPPRRPLSMPWLVVSIVAAILFVFVIRALLERTAWTAGASPATETTQPSLMTSAPEYAADVSEFHQQQVPSVYRCVDRAGGVSLQSQPCGPDQRTTKVVAAPPDSEPIRPRPQVSRPNRTSQASFNTVEYQQQGSLASREATCASARRQRASMLEQVGLKRTYDLLQRLDDMVNRACKGL